MSLVWAQHPDPEIAWIPARFIEDKGKIHVYETEEGERFQVAANEARKFSAAAQSSLTSDCSNLVSLEEFTEGAITHQLRKRYYENKIYTWIGTILVSMNPFKRLPIYTNQILHSYLNHADLSAVDPHCYAIAARAYQGLMIDHEPQAFIISGESGAGKTEATKLILQYLSEAAGSPEGVEQQILQTNPLLESFGNSKTLRNNNSSRFGKWMEIRFSKSGKISGARIVNYLLEKSRVVFQAHQERNYHIFYQLCEGADILDDELYRTLQLEPADNFVYLNQSGCLKVDGIDDQQEFQDTHTSLLKLGFSAEDMEGIYRIVAGILHLGNLTFRGDSGDGSAITSDQVLETAGEVLGIPSEDLQKALTTRSVKFGTDWTDIKLRPDDASGSRHSISKTLFSRLFDWIVQKVNSKLSISKDTSTIGVLDIFGFEVFQVNSFEQFCINFANEKLQQHFTHHIFKMEQEEYAAEGISVERVEFVDNEAAIQLIEGRPGLIAMIDEEVRVPKGSDKTLIEKLHQTFGSNGSSKSERYEVVKTNPDLFIVQHYAGGVEYNVEGFLEKNRDTLHESLSNVVHSSSVPLISSLFQDSTVETKKALSKTAKTSKQTLGTQFKEQLQSLMKVLNAASPHYVRCIKPNLEKVPNRFTSKLALAQMNYSGLFEAIRIRAMGFAYRKTFIQFWNSYCVCLTPSVRKEFTAAKSKGVQRILEELKEILSDQDIQMGKTKVFFRASQLSLLEKARLEAIQENVLYLQSRVRGFLARKYYARLKRIAEMIKKAMETHLIEDVQRAIQSAEERGVELFIMKDLYQLKSFLDNQKQVVKLLKQGLDAKDVDMLIAAVTKADKLEMTVKSRSQEALEHLKKAKSLLEDLKAIANISNEIGEAIASLESKKLKAVLEKAKKAGADPKMIEKASKELEDLERQELIVKALDVALSSKNIDALEEALKSTESIDLNDSREDKIRKGSKLLLDHHEKQLNLLMKQKKREEVKSYLTSLKSSFAWTESNLLVERTLEWISSAGGHSDSVDVLRKDMATEQKDEGKPKNKRIDGLVDFLPPPTPEKKNASSSDFSNFQVPTAQPKVKSKPKSWNALTEEEELVFARKLKKALADLDRDKLKKLLLLARSSGVSESIEMAQAREICYVMTDTQFIQLQIAHALDVEDLVLLKELIGEASRLGVQGEILQNARMLLSSKLEESRVQIEKAGRFRDYSSAYGQLKDLHVLSEYPLMKDPDDFGRKGLFVTKSIADGMLKFSDQPLPRCLLRHPLESFSSRAQQKAVKDELIRIFTDILCWMKIKFHQYPSSMGISVIQSALDEPLLRDEIYVQLIKQTTGNSQISAQILAFKLMYLCLSSFRPSKAIENCLKSHLAAIGTPLVSKFTAFDVVEEIASRCFELLSVPLEGTKRAPTEAEASMMFNLSSERLQVFLDFDADDKWNKRANLDALESGVGTLKRSKKKKADSTVFLRVPNVPKGLAHLLPYKEQDSVIFVEDLAAELSKQKKLPFVGSLYLKNVPDGLKEGEILSNDVQLDGVLKLISQHNYERKVEWHLCVGEKEKGKDSSVLQKQLEGLMQKTIEIQPIEEEMDEPVPVFDDDEPPPPPPVLDDLDPPPEPILYDSDGLEIPPPPLEDFQQSQFDEDMLVFFQNVPPPPPLEQVVVRVDKAESEKLPRRKKKGMGTVRKKVFKTNPSMNAEEKAKVEKMRKKRFEERQQRIQEVEVAKKKAAELRKKAAELKAKLVSTSEEVKVEPKETEKETEDSVPKAMPSIYGAKVSISKPKEFVAMKMKKRFSFKPTGNFHRKSNSISFSTLRKSSFQKLEVDNDGLGIPRDISSTVQSEMTEAETMEKDISIPLRERSGAESDFADSFHSADVSRDSSKRNSRQPSRRVSIENMGLKPEEIE